ncbi:MAG: lysophospholipase [Lachnospiraceae bacterium]|nr:lysophospholipase [Lachnospiraceae bacterium]
MRKLPENAIIYLPQEGTDIKGCIQIIHGMAEHQLRYAPLAKILAKDGYVVVTSDLRGHGENVPSQEKLGYFGDNAVTGLLSDVEAIFSYLKEEYPEKKQILLGHSMGTLIATTYFKLHEKELDGLILSGMPSNNSAKGIAKIMIKAIAKFKGWEYRSPFINNLCNGPFSKAFASEGSEFAWLSVNKDNVKKYEEDPQCGYVFTLNGFYTLMELMGNAYDAPWKLENAETPIRLISGGDDPCRTNDEMFMKSVEMFKKAGYKNVSCKLYKGQRHEIFNDTERETVFAELLAHLNSI